MLSVEHVPLHLLSEQEMADMLLYPGTLEFQIIHGNRGLYNDFMLGNAKNSAKAIFSASLQNPRTAHTLVSAFTLAAFK